MTQTATVTRLTLEQLGAMCKEKAPDKLPLFEEVSRDLTNPLNDRIACKEKLEVFVRCPVRFRVVGNEELYSWEGKNGTYELGLMKAPRDSTPEVVEESPLLFEVPPEAQAEPPAEPEQPRSEPQEAQAQQAQPAPSGLFAALAALLGDVTLLMTVARTGEEAGEPVLTVTVVPQGEEEGLSPVCLEGSVTELEVHFVSALTSKAESKKRLERAVAEMKAADKELEEAKKQEAEAKREQAESKKKAAEKKEAKVEEKEETKEPKAPEPQAALF
jgi:PRTRC genetic system protein E